MVLAEIRLIDLSFRYPGAGTDTLDGLSLQITRGEAHALLGSSGAGKTTLLNLLCGLLPAPPGRIFFDGRDVGTLAPWARRVTQVFQFPVLYEAMSVAENLAFPMRELGAAERRRRVSDIAGRLDIGALLALRPARLTLVQKQLVAIGKALTRPDVSLVLLDEPLTAAEPEHKWQLRQTLKAVQQELGATMIYVTHDQTEALTFAERVSVLHEGRILQTASPRTLVEQPTHEYVGYFVGSPGMNLIDGEVRRGACLVNGERVGDLDVPDGHCRFGFRAEQATLGADVAANGLSATITGVRILGAERGHRVGLVRAEVNGAEVVTRQMLDGLVPGPASLSVAPQGLLCFRDGARVVPHA